MTSWALIAAMLTALASPQYPPAGSPPSAQDPPQTTATLEDVVVEGRHPPVTRESAAAFVDQVSSRPYGALTLARWETPVCPEIVNLEGGKPAMILARIRARAVQAGAPVAGDDCRPNVSIVMTADGSATATDFVDYAPRAFRSSAGRVQRNPDDLRAFRASDAPIRWWHVSSLYDTRRRVFIGGSRKRPGVVNTDGEVYFNQNRRQAFLSALVIVDVSRLSSIDLNTLADYLALVILAEINPRPAGSTFPSILNLWENPARDGSLTSWDIGYLRGLYAGDVRISGSAVAVETGYQQSEIARGVLDAVLGSAADE